ncbi:regulator of sigma E protease [Trypanosoma cruzi]|nr:regulator of sigma E protease [Trypanosoma cruzi]
MQFDSSRDNLLGNSVPVRRRQSTILADKRAVQCIRCATPGEAAVPPAATRVRCWRLDADGHPSVPPNDAAHLQRILRSERHVSHHTRGRPHAAGTHRIVKETGIRQDESRTPAGNSHRWHHHKQQQRQHCRPRGNVDQPTHGVCGRKNVMA